MLFGIVAGSAARQVLLPQIITVGFLVISNFMSIGIAVINVKQAIDRDKRFLPAGYLGLITIGIGALLLALFGTVMGHHAYTYWAAIPYFLSGTLTLAVVLARR